MNPFKWLWNKIKQGWNWLKIRSKKFWGGVALAATVGGLIVLAPTDQHPIEYVTAAENNAYTIGRQNYDAVLKDSILEPIIESQIIDLPDKSTTSISVVIGHKNHYGGTVRYEVGKKYIGFTPVEMRWDSSSFKNRQNIQKASLTKRAEYKDTFGTGIDLAINTSDRVFEKIVSISSLEDLGNIPKDAQFLEIEFAVDTNFVIDGWNKWDKFEVADTIRIGDYSYLEPASAWDSYEELVCEIIDEKEVCDTLTNRIQIPSYFDNKDGQLIYTKQIPTGWLEIAQYPVFSDADIFYGYKSRFATSQVFYVKTAKLDENKFVTCYASIDAGGDGCCRVAEVAGSKMTYGTENCYNTDIYAGDSFESPSDVVRLDVDKFGVVYADETDDDGYAIVGQTSTGTDIVYGTAVEFENSDVEYLTAAQLGIDKMVACYNDETDSDTAKCCVMTVSGTTITAGTPVDVSATDYYPFVGGVEKLDADKFVYCFDSSGNSLGYCVVATVSGTIPTFGTVQQLNSTNPADVGVGSWQIDEFIAAWYRGAAPYNIQSRAATVSGTTITFGATTTYAAGSLGGTWNPRFATHGANNFIMVYHDNMTGLENGMSNYGSVDWATRAITSSTDESFEGGDIGGISDSALDVELIDDNKVVICYQDDAVANDPGECILGIIAPSTTLTDWSYYRVGTIEKEYVSTTTDGTYVIVASTTQEWLRTTTNGGKVEDDDGDFIFTDNVDGTTRYVHELEYYSSTTGAIVAWIRVPTGISSTTDTTMRIYYGNSEGTDFSEHAAVWGDATGIDPIAVWHLPETPTIDSFVYDSTLKNEDGTFNGSMTSADQITTILDGGLDFDGSNDYINIGDLQLEDNFSILFWMGVNSTPAGWHSLIMKQSDYGCEFEGDTFNCYVGDGADWTATLSTTISTPADYQVMFTYSGGSLAILYIDGIQIDSDTGGDDFNNHNLLFGSWDGSSEFFGGNLSEVRIYDIALTSDDVTTMYNMENDNSTFLTWGAEQTTGVTVDNPDSWNFWIKSGEAILKALETIIKGD